MTKIMLTAFRHKIVGPKGGIKIVHAVKREETIVFDNGSRLEAQRAFITEQQRLESLGYEVEVMTQDWYGKF